MARGFGSTYGVSGTTDKVTTSYTTVPSSTYSFAAWLWVNGSGQNGFGAIFNQQGGSNRNFVVYMDNSATNIGFTQYFSTTNPEWRIVGAGTGKWQHFGISYNASSTSNNPVIYINGVSTSVTRVTGPAGTPVNSSSAVIVGNQSTNINTFDGMMAEFAYWNGSILTASEFLALAKGVPPLLVRPTGLSLYLPLLGVGSGEPDWGPAHGAQTLTGTAKRNHAPVSFWMPTGTSPPPVFYKGSLALAQGSAVTAISVAEKFHAAAALTQPNVTLSIAGREKFSNYLSLTAPVNLALIYGMGLVAGHPGRAVIDDAMQGGLLACADQPTCGLAAADTALFDVQIMESI